MVKRKEKNPDKRPAQLRVKSEATETVELFPPKAALVVSEQLDRWINEGGRVE